MCADGLVFLILSGRHCAYTQRFQLEAISTVPATLNSLYIPSVAGSSVRYLMQHVRETMCDVADAVTKSMSRLQYVYEQPSG